MGREIVAQTLLFGIFFSLLLDFLCRLCLFGIWFLWMWGNKLEKKGLSVNLELGRYGMVYYGNSTTRGYSIA